MTACPTCGRAVPDQAAHEVEMAVRRAKYGAAWGLEPRKAYTVIDTDVVTEPAIPYTSDSHQEDDD